MSNDINKQICKVYTQLYPNLNILFVPRIYIHSRRATFGGELLHLSVKTILSLPHFGPDLVIQLRAMKRVGTQLRSLLSIQ